MSILIKGGRVITAADDYVADVYVESGQTSAAFGGTTTHVDFIIQPQGSSFADALEEWRGKANGKQMIDMGYHMAVTDLKEGGTPEELASLPDQGITSYKLFMAYK